MPRIILTDRGEVEHVIDAAAGLSLMESIREHGVDELMALCGGTCACATCHVYIDEAWMDRIGGPTSDENELLDSSSHRKPTSRLSCQIQLSEALDLLSAKIAPED